MVQHTHPHKDMHTALSLFVPFSLWLQRCIHIRTTVFAIQVTWAEHMFWIRWRKTVPSAPQISCVLKNVRIIICPFKSSATCEAQTQPPMECKSLKVFCWSHFSFSFPNLTCRHVWLIPPFQSCYRCLVHIMIDFGMSVIQEYMVYMMTPCPFLAIWNSIIRCPEPPPVWVIWGW